MALTDRQTEAINSVDGNLQIIACAGSGKTDVVSRRIAKIIEDKLAAPSEIVAFTFTEKAAAELKERIYRYVKEAIGHTEGLAEMYVGTMHGYCLEILQTYVPETFKFSVLPEIQTKLLVNKYSTQSGLTTCPTSSAGTPFLKKYSDTSLYVRSIALYREDEVDEDQVSSGFKTSLAGYLDLLSRHSYLDYTNILTRAVEAIEQAEGRPDLNLLLQRLKLYKYLTVDEYQDINPIQEKLIKALASRNAKLCVVGDDDQTIYQWRGSEVTNILTFAKRHKRVKKIVLDDNFRSSPGIVDISKIIASNIDAAVRLPKIMKASGHQEFKRGDILGLRFDTQTDEARWIANRIQLMQGTRFQDSPGSSARGLSWSDFAVLFRSVKSDAGLLVDIFRELEIPFIIKGLSRLFEADEVLAMQAAFRYAAEEIGYEDLELAWETARLTTEKKKFQAGVKKLEAAWALSNSPNYEQLNLQQLYLDFLEALDLKEDTVPGGKERGPVVFYTLGKFSQVISDFESVHFKSKPAEKLRTFTQWLRYDAPRVYEEAYAESGYAAPDAVVISTVHQAKGMQWPAVFAPALQQNRFPSRRIGGLNISHVIPAAAVNNFDRYLGNHEDERRLFYVAVTRAQKYLYLTFAPSQARDKRNISIFFTEALSSSFINTVDTAPNSKKLPPQAMLKELDLTITFSELKYLFECSYQFKLRFIYGFNSPIAEAMGFGRGLHDALSEVHKRALTGDYATPEEAELLVDRHLWTPFANKVMKENLRKTAIAAVDRYLKVHGSELQNTVFSEKRIQVHIGDGIVVDGRIDLIRRLDTDEVAIVDFKSKETSQAETLTMDQLHVYALGYKELTGDSADVLEILNLDAKGANVRSSVSEQLLAETSDKIKAAGEQIRTNQMEKHKNWCSACQQCDFVSLCRKREKSKN